MTSYEGHLDSHDLLGGGIRAFGGATLCHSQQISRCGKKFLKSLFEPASVGEVSAHVAISAGNSRDQKQEPPGVH